MLSGGRAKRCIQNRGEHSHSCACLGPCPVSASAGTGMIADESALVPRASLEEAGVGGQPVLALPSVQSLHCRERGSAHSGPAVSNLLPF